MDKFKTYFSTIPLLNIIKDKDVNFSLFNDSILESIPKMLNLGKINFVDINYDDPFGLSHETYFEECNIDKEIIKKIETSVERDRIILRCWTEEASTYWLNRIFHTINNPILKHKLLSTIQEEHEHFLISMYFIHKCFPDINVNEKYVELRNKFLTSFTDVDISNEDIVFEHFMGETYIKAYFKFYYKNTKNILYKSLIKKILADESNHVSYAKYFEPLITKKDYYNKRLNIIIRFLQKKGMNMFDYYSYKIELEKYNINIDLLTNEIKQSKKSQVCINDTIRELEKLRKDLCLNN